MSTSPVVRDKQLEKATKRAVLLNALCHEPLASLLSCLPFFLRKDLGATLFQLSILSASKPLLALISFYLTSSWKSSPSFLRNNLLLTGLGMRLCFLFFPFIHNTWFFVVASSLYWLFYRAGIPAWMEILKCNLTNSNQREKIFSISSIFGFIEGVLIALCLGDSLDAKPDFWKNLFLGAGLLGLLGLWIQMRLPIFKIPKPSPTSLNFKEMLLKPWKDTLELMRNHPYFARFQWAFMVGGFGIMMILNITPLYFTDILKLSYANFLSGKLIFMALGFVLTTPLWMMALRRVPIHILTCIVCASFAFFPFFLLFGNLHLFFVYLAFFFYGLSQGGSHLLWHLSGPIFAGKEDSSRYSNVNLVTVGIRGIIAPPLSYLLYAYFGSTLVFTTGFFLCLVGGIFLALRPLSLKKRAIKSLQ